jgi:hypothetical protein
MGLMRSAAALAAAVTLSLVAAPAPASIEPGHPPATCAGNVFADQIGTQRANRMKATAGKPERLYGLGGDDRLRGAITRAACLFGGPGNDVLDLAGGGGVAYGEAGGDVFIGSEVNDQLFGGAGLDLFDAGDGDDRIESTDGRPEVVYCRDGNDLVTADRVDVLIACETVVVNGPDAERLHVGGRPAGPKETVEVAMEAPFAGRRGDYRVVLVTGALGADCVDGPVEIGRAPQSGRIKAGQRLRLKVRPPRGERWCSGAEKAAVLFQRGRRPRPVARFQFLTR